MLRVQEAPGYQREDLVLTMDKLYENEKLDALTWATGEKLISMQSQPPKPKPEPPAETKAAPAEAAPAKAEAAPAEESSDKTEGNSE